MAAIPVTEDTFKQLIEGSKLFLSDTDGPASIIALVKFIDFVLADELKEFSRTANEKTNDIVRVHWKRVFANEITLLIDILKGNVYPLAYDTNMSLDGYANTLVLQCENLKKGGLLEFGGLKDQKPFCDLMGTAGYKFNQSTVLQRIEEYKSTMKASLNAAGSKTEDQHNISDLRTQEELIQSILRQMSWQFND